MVIKIFLSTSMFDFNHFLKDSKFYDSQNKMIVGKMKIERKGIPVDKFVGLKSEE